MRVRGLSKYEYLGLNFLLSSIVSIFWILMSLNIIVPNIILLSIVIIIQTTYSLYCIKFLDKEILKDSSLIGWPLYFGRFFSFIVLILLVLGKLVFWELYVLIITIVSLYLYGTRQDLFEY